MPYQFPYPDMQQTSYQMNGQFINPYLPNAMQMQPQMQQGQMMSPMPQMQQAQNGEGFMAFGVRLVNGISEVEDASIPKGSAHLFADRNEDRLYLKAKNTDGTERLLKIRYEIESEHDEHAPAMEEYVRKDEIEKLLEEWSKNHEQHHEQPQGQQSVVYRPDEHTTASGAESVPAIS